jgi:hypothetical protein
MKQMIILKSLFKEINPKAQLQKIKKEQGGNWDKKKKIELKQPLQSIICGRTCIS